MALDESRFPALIRQLYGLVTELEAMFPGRPFTPDGHMVGSLAECFAQYYYGLDLYGCSNPGHDAHTHGCRVEIKATQGNSVALRSGPERLLVFSHHRDGSFDEIYNGPGAPVWALVEGKPRPSNGQYQVRLTQLRRLMETVPSEQRLKRVRASNMALQRTRRPRVRSGRSPCSLSSPLNAGSVGADWSKLCGVEFDRVLP